MIIFNIYDIIYTIWIVLLVEGVSAMAIGLLNAAGSVDQTINAVKHYLSLDTLNGYLDQLIGFLPAPINGYVQQFKVLFAIVAASLFVLLAFEGYKLFKMGMYVIGAAGFGIVGYMFVAPYVRETLTTFLADIKLSMINPDVLVALLLALFSIFLTRCAYNGMLMLMGLAIGYYVGNNVLTGYVVNYFNTLEFLKDDVTGIVIGGLCGAVLAILFILLFKHIFMIATSFGCMVVAAYLTCSFLIPTADTTILLAFIILGIAIGVYACWYQYKEEEKSLEIVF